MPRRLTAAQIAAEGGAAPTPRQMTKAEIDAAGGGTPVDSPADHPVEAGAEATVEGVLPFGAGNEILKGFHQGSGSAATPEQAASQITARAEANPKAHLGGEVLSMFTPGPGALAKGASVVGKAANLGKWGTRAVTGAAEGGLFGLSAAMNEDTLLDPDLTAEHYASGTLGGGLAGVGAHLVLGKFGDVGKSALMKAFGGDVFKGSLKNLAEEALMRSVATEKDYAKRGLEGRKNEVARFALDEKLAPPGKSMKTAADLADDRAQAAYQEVQHHLDVADTFGAFDPVKAAARLQVKVDEMGQNPALAERQAKLQKFVDRLGEAGTAEQQATMNGKPISTYNPVTKKSEPMMVPGKPGTGPTTFSKAWDTVREMKGDPDLYRLRGDLQNELFEQVGAINEKLSGGLQQANRDSANALEWRTLTSNKAAKEGYTMGDMGAGAIGFHAGGLPGLLAPMAKRAVRERGGFVVASALDKLSESGALPKVADGFKLLVRSRLNDPLFGGPFRALLETAAAKGSMDLLQTHLNLAQSNPDYLPAVGLESEDPAAIPDHVDRAHRLSNIANAVTGAGSEIDNAIGGILGEGRSSAPRARRDPTLEEFERIKAKLRALASDDSAMKRQIADLAPTTATKAQMAIVTGVQHLLSTAPKNPTEGLPPALQRPWAPGKGDLRAWFRRVDALADPTSVLDSMEHGIVSSESVETLQLVFPKLYKDFQERMAARLSEWKLPLDRIRREKVAQLMGNMDDPAVVQLIQAAHLRAIPPKPAGPDGREVLDVEKNQQTQAQRLESR